MVQDHESSPLSGSGGRATRDDYDNDKHRFPLVPISEPPPSIVTRIASLFQLIAKSILASILGIASLVLLFVLTCTLICPLFEYYQSRRDKRALDRDAILRDHPEMFLLEIPPHINGASGGESYRVMVRLTKPAVDNKAILPPVIFPGGLASNLMTMSRHQDELSSRGGFTVVNFDRLGVGLSDPHPSHPIPRPPSAADVAREMNYIMTHIDGIDPNQKWIQVGGSMGTNVATAFMALFPNRLCGYLNLDGLPHAFIQIQCKKFLKDGPFLMNIMGKMRWTGIPRLAFTMATQPILPVIGNAFTKRQLIGVMCREQFFTTTGLEYVTLMSCCDLECAAWGRQATTEVDDESLRILASLAPYESVIVNESRGILRNITEERSKSELGTRYLERQDTEVVAFEERFRAMLALERLEDINKTRTHCNWPQPFPKHPVGEFVGGVDKDTTIHPLAPQFESMVVRIMCARDYTGLERDYTQEGRNHAAARCSLQVLASGGRGRAYYYPHLSHVNLWQQVSEVVEMTREIP